MNTPSDPGAAGKLAGGLSTLWGAATSAVKKRAEKKGRNDHFATGHGMSPEHLGLLIKGATELDAQQHRQGLERFTAVDAVSKPGKSVAMSAAGDISISEKRAKAPAAPAAAEESAPKESAPQPSMPNKPKKMRGASRGNRGGRTY